MATIGDRIKEKRKVLGFTQAELGKKLNVTDRAVSKWEQNNGNPDMSIITSLASVLGVTLDYLITGKVQEEKIVIKTPKEMLIETDDPTYLEKVNDLTFSDLYKNKLVKVFNYLVDSGKVNYYYGGRRNSNDFTAEILFMCLISNNLDKLNVFSFKDIGYADKKEWTNEMIDAFVSDERVTDETRKYVLTTHCRKLNGGNSYEGVNTETRHRFGNWQDMYPRFLDAFAVAKKWKWVKYLINVADDINKPAMDEYNERKNIRYGNENNYHILYNTPREVYQIDKFVQVMMINQVTLNALLDGKQYELLDQANKINVEIDKPAISSRTIELTKIKNNPDVKLKDRLIYELTSDYILNYNALFSSKTVTVKGPSKEENADGYLEALLKQYKDLYKEILNESSISFIELVYRGLKNKNLSNVFKLCADFNIKLMLEVLMNGDSKAIIDAAKKSFVFTGTKIDKSYNGYSRKEETVYKLNNQWVKSSDIKYQNELTKVESFDEIPNDVNKAIEYFDKAKETILKNWIDNIENKITHIRVERENQQEYERLSQEITSDYLFDLIAKGNEETAIIKLCVRLESILKHRYGYSGDLFTMLDSFFAGPLKYIETYKPYDDEDNNYQSDMDRYCQQTELNEIHAKWTESLSKLRMKRNNLVHAEKSNVSFTRDDLTDCIRIVEKIDTKEA